MRLIQLLLAHASITRLVRREGPPTVAFARAGFQVIGVDADPSRTTLLEGGVSPASPPAYSPRTHLFYTSTNNLCMDYASAQASHMRGVPFMGINSPYHAGPGGNLGTFLAWDAATGKKVWENKEAYPNWSGALGTAGDVAFYGTLDGWFKSVDARTGKVLVTHATVPTRSNHACPLYAAK